MTDEKLEFANELKRRNQELDDEIYKIMDICPAVRSIENFPKNRRGVIQIIKGRTLLYRKFGLKEQEIELSNEDCRALIDIRTAEREALQQVLSTLK